MRGTTPRVPPPLLRWATSRTSPLLPGLRLAWADLHNHTLLSDGAGSPEDAYAAMRRAGVDVAACTDHAASGRAPFHLHDDDRPHVAGTRSLTGTTWLRAAQAADDADAPGTFTAVRGFEWSSPVMGHVNVWGSADWTDPPTSGATPSGRGPHGDTPVGATMAGFHSWLLHPPDAPGTGGGADGLVGLNHPGREPGRFGAFAFEPALADRLVSLEVFNRDEDYLFEGVDAGLASPLVECLDAGWTPGLLGVSDHHDTSWGSTEGDGRAGLFLPRLTRAAVADGLRSRLFSATREPGLRLAALAGAGTGAAVPMGSAVDHASGPLPLLVDVDRLPGPDADPTTRDGGLRGRDLLLQVLGSGRPLPRVLATLPLRGAPGTDPDADTVVHLAVDVRAQDTDWFVLRLVDPQHPPDARATGELAAGRALAYAAPFWLRPGGGRR